MSRIIPFIAGFVFCAIMVISSVTLFAQGDNLLANLRPLIISIDQSVPLTTTVDFIVNGEPVTATVPLTIDVALQVRVSGVNSVTASSDATPTVAIATGETDTRPIQYVILKKESDERLSPVIIEGIRDDKGNFMLHVELKPTADISSGVVALRCYGPRQKVLCSISSLLQLEPSGNLVRYVKTDVHFEEVEWFELYWQEGE